MGLGKFLGDILKKLIVNLLTIAIVILIVYLGVKYFINLI
jgi:hypothetical protein